MGREGSRHRVPRRKLLLCTPWAQPHWGLPGTVWNLSRCCPSEHEKAGIYPQTVASHLLGAASHGPRTGLAAAAQAECGRAQDGAWVLEGQAGQHIPPMPLL